MNNTTQPLQRPDARTSLQQRKMQASSDKRAKAIKPLPAQSTPIASPHSSQQGKPPSARYEINRVYTAAAATVLLGVFTMVFEPHEYNATQSPSFDPILDIAGRLNRLCKDPQRRDVLQQACEVVADPRLLQYGQGALMVPLQYAQVLEGSIGSLGGMLVNELSPDQQDWIPIGLMATALLLLYLHIQRLRQH